MAKIELDMVGTDVEYFVVDGQGKPVPCIGLVGGTKKKPLPLISGREGYMIQEDNVALEWGIPPAKDRYSFIYHCMRAREAIDEKLKPMGLQTVIASSMRFDAKQLDHPQAKLLGCEADYDVWERMENPKPDITGENETLRTGAGHVHISFKVDGEYPHPVRNLGEMEAVVKSCDIYLGLASVLLDGDKERRKLYGKAGAFRPKEYGVEYRVLGSFWTKEPWLIEWVFSNVQRAIQLANHPATTFNTYQEKIVKAINTSDAALARALMNQWSVYMPTQQAA